MSRLQSQFYMNLPYITVGTDCGESTFYRVYELQHVFVQPAVGGTYPFDFQTDDGETFALEQVEATQIVGQYVTIYLV